MQNTLNDYGMAFSLEGCPDFSDPPVDLLFGATSMAVKIWRQVMRAITNKVSTKWKQFLAVGLLSLGPQQAFSQESIFAHGWTMDTEVSALRFQSVKNETKVDLRNVRMRFLMFETFKHPEAIVTLQIDPTQLSDLEDVRRKVIMAPYTINLHGVTAEREAEIAVTLLDDNRVHVTSGTPISIKVTDFGLGGGLAKLEEAAKVKIIPSATVTFDFTFNKAASPQSFQTAVAAMNGTTAGSSAAMEDDGNFELAACKGRFEILSRTNSIYFASSSARLRNTSAPLLDSIVEIVNRCPALNIRVDGHTDSDGSAELNQRISEARAQSVYAYLSKAGADGARIGVMGYGETAPIVENNSRANKQRNRRIEFTVVDQGSL